MIRWLAALFAVLPLAACGDVSSVRLELAFTDSALEAETQAVRVIVRVVPDDPSTACDDFEAGQNDGTLPFDDTVVSFPVEDPILVIDLDLQRYDQLTFIVLAYTTLEVLDSVPIAGACDNIAIDSDEAIPVRAILEPL